MARSYRRTPIMGMCAAKSEKLDKKLWHGLFRTRERENLAGCTDWEAFMTTHEHDISSPWNFAKDGKKWIDLFRYPHLIRDMRK